MKAPAAEEAGSGPEAPRSRRRRAVAQTTTIAQRAAEYMRREVQAYAAEHRAALWAERAPHADTVLQAIHDLARDLDGALATYAAFAAGSDRLCRLTGRQPSVELPIVNVAPARRALADVTANLPLPLPRALDRADKRPKAPA